jgi:hypothetical protein
VLATYISEGSLIIWFCLCDLFRFYQSTAFRSEHFLQTLLLTFNLFISHCSEMSKVAVVGQGVVGCSTALALLEKFPGLRVSYL